MVGGCHFQAFWVGSKPVRSNFFIFLEPGKKSENFFSRKNRFLSEKSEIFLLFFYFRFFHPKIFSSTTEIRFFSEKSDEIGDFFVHAPNAEASIQVLEPPKRLPKYFRLRSCHIVSDKPMPGWHDQPIGNYPTSSSPSPTGTSLLI